MGDTLIKSIFHFQVTAPHFSLCRHWGSLWRPSWGQLEALPAVSIDTCWSSDSGPHSNLSFFKLKGNNCGLLVGYLISLHRVWVCWQMRSHYLWPPTVLALSFEAGKLLLTVCVLWLLAADYPCSLKTRQECLRDEDIITPQPEIVSYTYRGTTYLKCFGCNRGCKWRQCCWKLERLTNVSAHLKNRDKDLVSLMLKKIFIFFIFFN